jgi:predicted RNase H-like nuclease (RuvC/YqgF family)
MKMQVNSHQAEIQRLEHAVTSCHKDLSIVLLEKQANDVSVNEARMQVSQYQKLVEDSENTVRKLEIGQQVLRDENDSLKGKIDSLNNENETLKGKMEGVRLQKILLSNEQEKEVTALHNDLDWKDVAVMHTS